MDYENFIFATNKKNCFFDDFQELLKTTWKKKNKKFSY